MIYIFIINVQIYTHNTSLKFCKLTSMQVMYQCLEFTSNNNNCSLIFLYYKITHIIIRIFNTNTQTGYIFPRVKALFLLEKSMCCPRNCSMFSKTIPRKKFSLNPGGCSLLWQLPVRIST